MASLAFSYPEHALTFTVEQDETRKSRHGWRRIKDVVRARSRRSVPDSAIIYDCRWDAPGNLAHVMQYQLGPTLMGLEALELRDRTADVHFIVHPQCLEFEVNLLRTFGFENIHRTEDPVAGTCLIMNPSKCPLRSVVSPYLRQRAIDVGILSPRTATSDPIFIKRRRRTAINLDEVTAIANRFGYEDVYLETLPMRQQIQRVATASRVFALHGAALGFLYLRDPEHHGCVVEAFSSGFANNWARANAVFLGDSWIGLQGDLDPDAIKGLAAGCHPHSFEGMDYRLGQTSVTAALGLAETMSAGPTGSPCPFSSSLLPSIGVEAGGHRR